MDGLVACLRREVSVSRRFLALDLKNLPSSGIRSVLGVPHKTRREYIYVHLLLCNTILITISCSLVLAPSPMSTGIFSNKGKTAYVYPAY